MSDPVRCHAGWRYPERPQTILWEGSWLNVSEVLKAWRGPLGLYFWVQTEDERRFELFYDEVEDNWQLKLL